MSLSNKFVDNGNIIDINNCSDKNKADKKHLKLPKKLSYFHLYRFATKFELFLIFIGTLFALINGAAMPIFSIFFGTIINKISVINAQIINDVSKISIWLCVLGVFSFFLSSISFGIFMYTSEKQIIKCKKEFLQSVLNQDISWHDLKSEMCISSHLSKDIIGFSNAIGEKVPMSIKQASTFICGIVIGFYYGWQLALIVFGCVPLIAITMSTMSFVLQNQTKKCQKAYEEAGSVVSDAFKYIKTVTAFSGQHLELEKYNKLLNKTEKIGINKSILIGGMTGIYLVVMISVYGLALWFAAWLIRNGYKSIKTREIYTGGDLITSFFIILIGGIELGKTIPFLNILSCGCVSASNLFNVIYNKSNINTVDQNGKTLENYKGSIDFRNISFEYPTRSNYSIFNNLNISFEPGKTTAIIGPSGIGKSTILSLIERFYDPKIGNIFADDVDIKELDLKWWRNQIGYVEQDPQFFNGTIKDCIKSGKPDASENEIIDAAKAANAHSFIRLLKNGYNSLMGEQGSFFSGGQKQMIAIARVLIKNPKILLLDEVTSALDNKSEQLVKKALEKLVKGRTTIFITHNLFTVEKADKIIVLKNGVVIEQGTHNDLLQKQGVYFNLFNTQNFSSKYDEILLNKHEDDCKFKTKFSSEQLSDENKNKNKIISIDSSSNSDIDCSFNKLNKSGIQTTSNNQNILSIIKSRQNYFLWIVFGCLFSGVLGVVYPAFSILISKMIIVFYEIDTQKQERGSIFLAVLMFILAISQLIAGFGNGYCFGVVGEYITKYLRYQTFESMLNQEVSWFDEKDNDAKILVDRLETDAVLISKFSSGQFPVLSQTLFTVIIGLIISLYNSLELSFIVIATAPILFYSSLANMKIFTSFSENTKEEFTEMTRISTEAFSNIRTVFSFTLEDEILSKYSNSLEKYLKIVKKKIIYSSLLYGLSQSTQFFVYALAFWFGAKLMVEKKLAFDNMITALFTSMITIIGTGEAVAMMPDFQKAEIARNNIFSILNKSSQIDTTEKNNQNLMLNAVDLCFEDVYFAYSTRKEIPLFKGLSFNLKNKKTVALVGRSGSGKSTILSIILRLYTYDSGTVTLGNNLLEDFNLNDLRSQIGLVEQNPKLFNISIKENIIYGNPNATNTDIIEASKAANIHHVIETFPNKYETNCGKRGSLLSGGQKQRIAIARAIIKKPKILLLDEITSSLNRESEIIIQNALDDLMKNSKSIQLILFITHRLNTIKNCDFILVLDHGKIVESGNHETLVKQNGFYNSLLKESD